MENRIKELRIQRKMTQNGLAMQIGCSQNLISRIELGLTSPDGDVLKSVARFFNVSVDYLLYETDLPYRADVYVNPKERRMADYLARFENLPLEKQKAIELILAAFESQER